MAKEPKVGTFADLIELRHDLTLYCESRDKDGRPCLHSAKVDVSALAERYGIDTPVQWLMEHSHCSICGARWPEIECTVSPNFVPKHY